MKVTEKKIYKDITVERGEQELLRQLVDIAEAVHDELGGLDADCILADFIRDLAVDGYTDIDEWR
jgi:hypothetical protein